MGDNYYLYLNICESCNREHKKMHIGKSSGGWTFSFRGYRDDYEQPKILSYDDWLDFLEHTLSEGGSEIRDEYDTPITLEDFKDMVKRKMGAKHNHTLYCQVSHPEHAARDCWLDPEGHSFSGCEFS